MAAIFDVTEKGAYRNASTIAASSDESWSAWVYVSVSDPVTPFSSFLYLGNDPITLYTQYMWIGQRSASAGEWVLDINGTAIGFTGVIPTVGWHHLAYTRIGTSHRLYYDGLLINTQVLDISALVFTDAWLGSDSFANDWQPSKMAYVRRWSVGLTVAEINAERISATVVKTADLWGNWPLASNLQDIAGSARHLSESDGTVAFEHHPSITVGHGWTRRSISAVATGTTSLTINAPAGVTRDDIMIMSLAHKGAGWAVAPADWTLVGREISGTIRGEMYWRRAEVEGANYSVTGLADVAIGVIEAYEGGLSTGNVVDMVVTRANASGASGVGAFTTLTDRVLVVGMQANAANLSSTGLSFVTGSGSSFPNADSSFVATSSRVLQGSATGTDAYLAVSDKIKQHAGAVISAGWSGPAADNVGIVAAFIPEPAGDQAKYYLTATRPATPLRGPMDGDWGSTADGPNGYNYQVDTRVLGRYKTDGGLSQTVTMTNNQDPHDVMLTRWVTPPLAAQTLTNMTLRFVNRVRSSHPDGAVSVRYKVHVYLSTGQTLTRRTLLVDNSVDSVDWTSTQTYREFTVSFPASVAVTANDSIVIELGFSILSAPSPAPTNPPTKFTSTLMERGATVSGVAFPGVLDGVVGGTATGFCPFVEFSTPLVEAAATTPPANISCAAAVAIATTPYKVIDADVSSVSQPGRQTWHTWVATATQRMIVHLFGSTLPTACNIFSNRFGRTCGTFISGDVVSMVTSRIAFSRVSGCQTSYVFDAVLGETYHFQIIQVFDATEASYYGAAVSFELCPFQTPQVDDLYYPVSSIIVVLREGQIVGVQPDFGGAGILSGVAIDYTRNEMLEAYHTPGTPHTDYRLLVALFGSSALVEILDMATLNCGRSEIDYIADAFAATAEKNTSTLEIDEDGVLHIGHFGNGFLLVANGSSAYEDALATAGSAPLLMIEATKGDLQAGAPFAAVAHAPTLDKTGVDYIRLMSDGTVLYSSSGQYAPVAGTKIQRYDPASLTQLADFAAVGAGTGPNPGPKGICVLLDGGILVCNGARVERYSAAGALTQTYTPSPAARAATLADVDLTNDFEHFWVMNSDFSNLFKFNLATGVQEAEVQTYLGVGNSTSFVVFRPSRFTTPSVDAELPYEISQIRRLRRAPHLSGEAQWAMHHDFSLEVEAGVGLNTGAEEDMDPQIMLHWSDDGGHTWSNEHWRSLGRMGRYDEQVNWTRLGRSRDRIYEVITTAAVKIAIIDAYLSVTGGTS